MSGLLSVSTAFLLHTHYSKKIAQCQYIHSVRFGYTKPFLCLLRGKLLISIWANISAHMEMIGFVARIGTISKGLDKPPI